VRAFGERTRLWLGENPYNHRGSQVAATFCRLFGPPLLLLVGLVWLYASAQHRAALRVSRLETAVQCAWRLDAAPLHCGMKVYDELSGQIVYCFGTRFPRMWDAVLEPDDGARATRAMQRHYACPERTYTYPYFTHGTFAVSGVDGVTGEPFQVHSKHMDEGVTECLQALIGAHVHQCDEPQESVVV
jgi:hypothetical protein